jgi:CRISPR-associated protein Csb2
VRQNRDGRDELDWPPAPARLHQAFIASALANLPDSQRSAYGDQVLDALRWLETLAPPEIAASTLADDREHRRALLVAMPHNSPAKPSDFAEEHTDLAPVFRATPKHDGNLFVAYRWMDDSDGFREKSEMHLPALREAAAKLRYLGRAEDRVECDILWRDKDNELCASESMEVWRPSPQAEDVRLWAARPQSTDDLMADFKNAARRGERQAKNPARRFLREQRYARDAAEGLQPVHIAMFHIFRDTGNPDEPAVACDAINAHRWRSPLRALACRFAADPTPWNDSALAKELICGHTADGGHTQQPHLAFVPLPSLSLRGKADGRVRRFGLFGYTEPWNAKRSAQAVSIYRTLAACLDGEEIESGYRLQLVSDPWADNVWRLYAGSSRVWLSATPIAIERGYKVPTHSPSGHPISSNERHLRRLSEWTKLVSASLRHIRIPDDLVVACRITLTASPLLVGVERAERYRFKSERIPFVHARLEFPRAVRGPLLVGDRRYFGLGLFIPSD